MIWIGRQTIKSEIGGVNLFNFDKIKPHGVRESRVSRGFPLVLAGSGYAFYEVVAATAQP